MRILPWLALAISLTLVSSAEGRLFWQTFGSTVPTADGWGSTWNANQDYFVPRHSTTGQYGLYSPCKSSRSTSPACKTCHPLYPGYCGIYGPCHYKRRDRVYGAKCGSSPLGGCASGNSATGSCVASGCVADDGIGLVYEPMAMLHNVEPAQFDSLGSIPVEGNGLLTNLDFPELDEQNGQQLLSPRQQPTIEQLEQQLLRANPRRR